MVSTASIVGSTLPSGFVGDLGGVVNEDHFFFSDFFILGNHFSESLKIDSPFGFHPETGIVSYAAPIVTAPALPAGTALRHRRPFVIQTPVKLSSTTAVIDNSGDFEGIGHGWQHTLILSMMDQHNPLIFIFTLKRM